MRTLNPFLSVVIAVLLIRGVAAQSAEPEDPQVRARAISLLEHAVQLSSPVWPMNEESFTFHLLNPEPGAANYGSIKILVARPDLKRWDYTYGAYQYSRVQDGKEFATYRTGPEPVGLAMVRKLIPVNLVRFDQSDLIRAIGDQSIDGTLATCVDFETIAGTRHQSGTLCFDKAAGYLIYTKIDDVVTKQSKFYRFNNGFLPGHIERWTNGAKLVETESNIEVRSAGFPMENFEYPVGATMTHACNSFTPAYADYTVQPVAKQYSDKAIDIVVHGYVDQDGHTTNLKVLDETNADLAAEALKVVSTWTFRPAQCNYQPAARFHCAFPRLAIGRRVSRQILKPMSKSKARPKVSTVCLADRRFGS